MESESSSRKRVAVVVEKSGVFPSEYYYWVNPARASLDIRDYISTAQIFSEGSTPDILCLGINNRGKFQPNCSALVVGSMHETPLMAGESPVYPQQPLADGTAVGW